MKTLIACLAFSLSLLAAPAFADRISDLTTAANSGDAEAQIQLGIIYYEGKIVAADYVKARVLFQQNLTEHTERVILPLAHIYEDGLGIAPVPDEAERLYILAGHRQMAPALAWLSNRPEATLENLRRKGLSPAVASKKIVHAETTKALNNAFGVVSEAPQSEPTIDAAILEDKYFFKSYPKLARKNKIDAQVIFSCRWTEVGNMENCVIVEEKPLGYGFGMATIKAFEAGFKINDRAAWVETTRSKSLWFRFMWVMD